MPTDARPRGARAPVSPASTIELRGIRKRYGSVLANDGVDLRLEPGRLHVLLGENGAGKSTLMKILFGMVEPDAGEIVVDGRPTRLRSARDALAHGVGMVHQHFMLIQEFTVAEAVSLGSRPSLPGWRSRSAVRAQVAEVANRFGLELDPDRRINTLSIDLQQRVEILKLLYRGARTLILDEPTSTLGPREVGRLFDVLGRLREQGQSIVIITHKLAEALAIADDVTVLRHGRVVSHAPRAEVTEEGLARAMVGGVLPPVETDRPPPPGADRPAALEVSDLTVDADDGSVAVDGLDLEVRPGEIVAVAGVEGNGQRELAEALCGLRSPRTGSIALAGEQVAGAGPRALHALGVGMITEDRHRWDIIGDFTLAENLAICDVAGGRYRRRGLLDLAAMRQHGMRLVADYAVQPPDVDLPAGDLSGGNQQKLVVARELSADPILLVASQPTRGVDIAATRFVHEQLLRLRTDGCAIVLVTLDLDELMALADRVVVLYRGRAVYADPIERVTIDALARAMTGLTTEAQPT